MSIVRHSPRRFAAAVLLVMFATLLAAAPSASATIVGGETITSIATAAQLGNPAGVAVDASGNVYVADAGAQRVHKITPAGVLTTYAGTGTAGFSGDGGAATSAQLNFPNAVAVDTAGNVYVADTVNHRVRKIVPGGTISTIAGTGAASFSGDGGTAITAALNSPFDVEVDTAGNVYIADRVNHRIRKVNAGGIISTIAGNGTVGFSGDDGAATTAQISLPEGVTLDAAGNVYISDTGNQRVRKVNTGGIISTIAGNGTGGFSGDGAAATAAQIDNPRGLALDTAGNLYISDASNDRIRRVATGGTISTVVGTGTAGSSGDDGAANAARIDLPTGLAVDSAGSLYIADTANDRIRKVAVDAVGPVATVSSPAIGTSVAVGTALNAVFSCSDSGGSGLVSCTATLDGAAINSGDAISTAALGGKALSVTATDGNGNTAITVVTLSVTPPGRAVTSFYTAQDIFNINTAAAYLNMDANTFQRTGVAVLRFINALVGNKGPVALGEYAPAATGPQALTSYWLANEEETLTWVNTYYVTPEIVSQKVGVTLLYFLASIDARNKATPLAQFTG